MKSSLSEHKKFIIKSLQDKHTLCYINWPCRSDGIFYIANCPTQYNIYYPDYSSVISMIKEGIIIPYDITSKEFIIQRALGSLSGTYSFKLTTKKHNA